MESFTRPREQIGGYQVVAVGNRDAWKRVDVEGHRPQSRHQLIRFAGVGTREDAEQYIGCDVGIEYGQLTELSEGEFYWVDLMGLSVVNVQGVELGEVTQIMETGANDVLVSRHSQGEILIPWISSAVMKVELEQGLIVVDWQEDFL